MHHPTRVRIVIVDEYAISREGLARFLKVFMAFELVGEAPNVATHNEAIG